MSSEAISHFPGVLPTVESARHSPLPATDSSAENQICDPRPTPALHIETTDEELLVQVATGSKDALGLLYRRIAPSVYRVASRILNDEGEAEDLVHEVFLFLFRSAQLFDPAKSSARTWIIQAACHRAFDRRRFLNARRHYVFEEMDIERLLPQQNANSEQRSVDGIAMQEIVKQFEAVLSIDQRRTIELHFFEGQSFREIADQTGESLVNIRNQYYRGRERLRAHFFPSKEATK